MLANVTLPFHPIATDCLAWSPDGELAIAGGEFVHLLIPKRSHGRDQHDSAHSTAWVHVSFRVNAFTFDEWPPQELASLDHLNLGEEQSIGSIVSLSWSHVGLAKHKRSALAILTTNHVLSLWASSSDPKVAASWERVLVVNAAFNVHSGESLSSDSDGEVVPNALKQSMRIRSMSWATPAKEAHRDAGKMSRGQSLAVTDDADGVAILQITSPWSCNDQPFWEARIQCQNQWESLVESLSACDGSTAAEKDFGQTVPMGRAQQWPSHFAASLGENSFIESVVCFSFSDSYRGLRLVLRKRWQVLQIEISFDNPSQTFTNQGLAMSSSGKGECTDLHASGLLSGTYTFSIKSVASTSNGVGSGAMDPVKTAFEEQLSDLLDNFDRKRDLGGLSFAKTWGLACWGPYLACCSTLHPGDMVEYNLPSYERCHILFCQIGAPDDVSEDEEFPWESRPINQGHDSTRVIIEDLLPGVSGIGNIHSPVDYKVVFSICCAAMVVADTLSLQTIQSFLHRLSASSSINFDLEKDMLEDNDTLTLSADQRISRLNEHARSRCKDLQDTGFYRMYDKCSICDAMVLWKSLTEATCTLGHLFGRCALTFLAVTEPGISKYCESCNREYLNDATFPQPQEPSDNMEDDMEFMDVDYQDGAEDTPANPEESPIINTSEGAATFETIFTKALFERFDTLQAPPEGLKTIWNFTTVMASTQSSSARKPSITNSTGSNVNPNTTIDRFDAASSADEADPDEEIAAHTLADFVNYPNDSRTAVKSPAPRNHFRSGSISLAMPSGSASFATSSSVQQDASTRAMKSPRGSASTGGSYVTPASVLPPDRRKGSVASAVSSSSPDGFPASEAVATPSDGDSPTLGRFPLPPITKVKKGKARDSMLLNRYSHTSEGSGRERKESTPTIDTQNTEKKAEKGLVIPFLPKFLKLAGSPRHSVSIATEEPPRDSMEITEVDEIPRQPQNDEPVKSTFEADSSDEDNGQPYDATAFIGGAKLAASQRPTLLARGNTANGTRVMSMQDILKEGGVEAVADHLQRSGTSVMADANPGPSTLKAKRFLGESSLKQKRAGIVGMPAVHETTGGVPVSLDGADEPVKEKPSWQKGLFDGLRSNPVKRAATAPSGKKVVLPLQIGEEQKNVRNSIVSTPYPLGYKGRRSGDEEEMSRLGGHSNQGKHAGRDEVSSIMLVLYSRSTNTPVIRKVLIPDSKEEVLFDADEKKPPFRATRQINIDDEKLFQLLKIEYLHMRGLIKGYISARSVQGISLLGYHRLSQLAAREHRPARRKTFRVYDDIFTEQRLMDLWKSPAKGRAKHEWVEWIRTLPRCSEDLQSGEENVALELVEGWH
ncbi:MAG: hypothetical protein Q9174_002974, partial [Haloplaca sp. 1 TL-2023]